MLESNATPSFKNFIAGKWIESVTGEVFDDVNPADTRDLIATFPKSSREDARAAIDSALGAKIKWEAVPPPQRGKILFRAAEIIESKKGEIARLFTREEGKVLTESRAEVSRTVDILKFFAGEGQRLGGEVISSDDPEVLLFTKRYPLGVVSVITPWNFPLAIPAWKIAPALVCGNTVVFKPASLTPIMGFTLVEALENSGLPDGVLNFVTGPGSTVGVELIENHSIDAISFTGSYNIGKEISKTSLAIGPTRRIQLEMGGKNPLVVLSDADLSKAVEITIKGAFGGTGQACTATSRVIVEKPVLEDYTRLLVQRVGHIKVGNGLEEINEMGPAVSEGEITKDLDYVEIGKKESAVLLCGGRRLRGPGYDHGFFMEPTVFSNVQPSMRIAREEIFGPIVSILTADNFERACELANDSDYGLSASICTNSLDKTHLFLSRIQAGVVKVNRPTTGVLVQAPFGGMKKSSSMTFKEQGTAALDFYTFTKAIYLGFKP